MTPEQIGTNTNCMTAAIAHMRRDCFQSFLRNIFMKSRPDRMVIPKPVPIIKKGSYLINSTTYIVTIPRRVCRNAMAKINFNFGGSTLHSRKLIRIVNAMIPQRTRGMDSIPMAKKGKVTERIRLIFSPSCTNRRQPSAGGSTAWIPLLKVYHFQVSYTTTVVCRVSPNCCNERGRPTPAGTSRSGRWLFWQLRFSSCTLY